MANLLDLPQETLLRLDAVVRAAPVIHGELLRRSFHRFVMEAWHVLEPSTKFQDNWHVRAICDHLEAVTKGDITRLIINIPPRFLKSNLVSVLWPCWTWANDPGKRFLTASYAKELATRDAVAARRLMESPWFKERFGFKFQFTSDQNVKTRYENNKRGYRVTTSVDAAVTGEGGDVILVDDPLNAKEGASEATKKACNTWWSESMTTRFNDPNTGAAVIIMQRLAQDDLTGYLLEQGGWDHLILPMRYEKANAKVTSIGYKDPRTKDGELLFPDRFDEEATKRLERELGSFGTAGQLQQRPSPRGGAMIKTEWLGEYKEIPIGGLTIMSLDAAKGGKEVAANAYHALTVWKLHEKLSYLLFVKRDRMGYPDLKKAMKMFGAKFKPNLVLIEDHSTGQALIQDLNVDTDFPYPIIAVAPETDKITRVSTESPYIEAGGLLLPKKDHEWKADYVTELTTFPASTYADQVDSTSQYLAWVRNRGTGVPIIVNVGGKR